jgi:glutamate decarboxylase
MRMVIKENFSRDMVELLFSDIMHAYHSLELSEAEREARAKGKEKLSLLY